MKNKHYMIVAALLLLMPADLFSQVSWGEDLGIGLCRYYSCGNYDTYPCVADRYVIEGTRELNGRQYYDMHCARTAIDVWVGAETSEDWFIARDTRSTWDDFIGIREEGGRFLVDRDEYMALLTDEEGYWCHIAYSDSLPYEVTPDGELVLYDFTKVKGDVYAQAEGHDPIMVVDDEERVVTLDSVSRRVLVLSNGLKIIEGIGCINSKGCFLFYLNARDIFFNYNFLTNYCHESLPIPFERTYFYTRDYKEQADEMKSNVVDGVDSPIVAVPQDKGPIFQLDGRRVQGTPQRGLYIRNGKKVLK